MQVITVLTYYLLVIQTVPARGFTGGPCGKSLVKGSERIGMTEWKVADGEFPFVANLKVGRNYAYYHCLGALITSEFVLTSARCIDGMHIDQSRVSIGMLDRNGDSQYTFVTGVQLLIVHEDYFQFWKDDIGLAKLSVPVDFNMGNGRIGIVCLPQPPYTQFTKVTVIGWGNPNTASWNPTLRAALVPKIDSQECERWSPMFNEHTFCTGDSGGKRCMGGHGIPAVVRSKRGWVLVGLSSYIFKCGVQPAYYTYVVEYMDWIQSTIRKHQSRRRRG